MDKKRNLRAIGVITKIVLQNSHGSWIATICGKCPYTPIKPTKFILHYGLSHPGDNNNDLSLILQDADTPDNVSALKGTLVELTYASKTDVKHSFSKEDKKLKHFIADDCSIKVLKELMCKKKK